MKNGPVRRHVPTVAAYRHPLSGPSLLAAFRREVGRSAHTFALKYSIVGLNPASSEICGSH
jgi:hypothetical protein